MEGSANHFGKAPIVQDLLRVKGPRPSIDQQILKGVTTGMDKVGNTFSIHGLRSGTVEKSPTNATSVRMRPLRLPKFGFQTEDTQEYTREWTK